MKNGDFGQSCDCSAGSAYITICVSVLAGFLYLFVIERFWSREWLHMCALSTDCILTAKIACRLIRWTTNQKKEREKNPPSRFERLLILWQGAKVITVKLLNLNGSFYLWPPCLCSFDCQKINWGPFTRHWMSRPAQSSWLQRHSAAEQWRWPPEPVLPISADYKGFCLISKFPLTKSIPLFVFFFLMFRSISQFSDTLIRV